MMMEHLISAYEYVANLNDLSPSSFSSLCENALKFSPGGGCGMNLENCNHHHLNRNDTCSVKRMQILIRETIVYIQKKKKQSEDL